jgi:hypothetical protein
MEEKGEEALVAKRPVVTLTWSENRNPVSGLAETSGKEPIRYSQDKP